MAENDVASLSDVFIQLHGPGRFANQVGKSLPCDPSDVSSVARSCLWATLSGPVSVVLQARLGYEGIVSKRLGSPYLEPGVECAFGRDRTKARGRTRVAVRFLRPPV